MLFNDDFDQLALDFYSQYYGDKLNQKDKKWIYTHKNNDIDVAGDVCFNLNLKNGKFYTFFGSIIQDEEIFDELESLLGKMRYSPMNISIMPRTGGLNNIKKAFGNDRFDTFAWLVNLYYEGVKTPIINAGALNMKVSNRIQLKKFLDSYEDVYDYYSDVYKIDKTLTGKLVCHGQCLIIHKVDVYKHIELALDFWEVRMSQKEISQVIKQSDVEFNKVIGEIRRLISKKL